MQRIVLLALALLALAAPAVRGCSSLAASTPCTLVVGQPAAWEGANDIFLESGHAHYYQFTVTATPGLAVQLSLGVIVGQPMLYVTRPPAAGGEARTPTTTNYDFSSADSSSGHVLTLPPAVLRAGTHTYKVMVYADRISVYRLLMSTSAVATELTIGEPFRGAVQAGEYAYFQLNSPAGVDAVDAVLTNLAGDADLYYGPRPFPNATTATQSSTAQGGDSLTIPVTGGLLFFSVFGFRTSSFALTVTGNSGVSLRSGLPQRSQLAQGAVERLFYIRVANGGPLHVHVSASRGVIRLLARGQTGTVATPPAFPTASEHDWQVSGTHSATLAVEEGDPHYVPMSGLYTFAVTSPSTFNSNAFTITATVGAASVQTLRAGVPTAGLVGGTEQPYDYFQLFVSSSSTRLTVALTAVSGDPDLFMSCSLRATGTDTGVPSLSNHTWSSNAVGSDWLQVPASDPQACAGAPGHGATYYIAVRSFHGNASYVITARSSEDALPSLSAEPVTGQVDKHSMAVYRLRLPPGSKRDVTLALTALSGDPDLLARVGLTTAVTRSNAQWREASGGGGTLVIAGTDPLLCADCWLQVAVYGFTAAQFTLSATFSGGSTVLTDGVPSSGQLAEGSASYYRFDVVDSSLASLEVTLTALSGGDPDLFMSRTVQQPSASAHTWQSARVGSDSISIPAPALGPYYIAVVAYHASTFVLTAHGATAAGDGLRRLLSGLPASGQVTPGAYAFFAFTVTAEDVAAERLFTFTVSSPEGDVALLMGVCQGEAAARCDGSDGGIDHRPRMRNAHWRSDRGFVSESLTISATEACGVSGASCQLMVSIYGESATSFTLRALPQHSLRVMSDSVPLHDSLLTDQWAYYTFTVLSSLRDLTIAVTPLYGDPDLFVTACPYTRGQPAAGCLQRPNMTDFTWTAQQVGADGITIPRDDARGCHATPTSPCHYFVGVYAYRNSSYTLLYTATPHLPVLLSLGRPQAGLLSRTSWQYYSLPLPQGIASDEQLTITLTPQDGDPDIYLRLDGHTPTRSDFWRSSVAGLGTEDSISFSGADAAQWCSGGAAASCALSIGVFAVSESSYSIVVTRAGSLQLLQDGRPLRTHVPAGAVGYYAIRVPQTTQPVVILLTELTGRPTLYVSATVQRPNATAHSWASSRAVFEIITIEAGDAAACHGQRSCMYYIAAASPAASGTAFQLLARIGHATTPQRLVSGLPQIGSARTLEWSYYQLLVGDDGVDIDITATPLAGSVALFVNNVATTTASGGVGPPELPVWRCVLHAADGSCSRWSVYHSVYSSIRSFSRERISISHSGPHYCQACTYIIGVLGTGTAGANNFTLLATTSASTTTLQNGVAVQDRAPAGSLRYYHFIVPTGSTGDVVFRLTPFAGWPRMVAAPYSHPNLTHHVWAQRWSSQEVVVQHSALPADCGSPCSLFLTVAAGSHNASYTLLATLGDSWQDAPQLTAGTAQAGAVNASEYSYFRFRKPAHSNVTITLTTLSGDADLFVNTHAAQPSRSAADLSSDSVSRDSVSVYAGEAGNHCGLASPCWLYVAVYGFLDASFSVVATVSTGGGGGSVQQLQQGLPTAGSAPSGGWRYYSLAVPAAEDDVTLVLTALAGDPDMFVIVADPTQPLARPDQSHYTWATTERGGGRLRVLHSDPAACTSACSFLIGIYAFGGAARYTLLGSVSENAVVLLADGRPQHGQLSAGSSRYYRLLVDDTQLQRISFTLSLLSGAGTLYIKSTFRALPSDQLPGPADYDWKSTDAQAGSPTVTAVSSDAHFVNTGSYTIAVVAGSHGATYNLLASTAAQATQLQAGSPLSVSLPSGGSQLFSLAVPDGADVTVSMTLLAGLPMLLMQPPGATPPSCPSSGGACSAAMWAAAVPPLHPASVAFTLAADAPCDPESGVTVSAACTDAAYKAGVFTLLLHSPVGPSRVQLSYNTGDGHLLLADGAPLEAHTRRRSVCTAYSASGAGSCTSHTIVDGAFFELHDGDGSSDIVISVRPDCASAGGGGSTPLDCLPPVLAIIGCPVSASGSSATSGCSRADAWPSQAHSDWYSTAVTTVTLARGDSEHFCTPPADGGSCTYYVAVYAPTSSGSIASSGSYGFTISYASSDSTQLVASSCLTSASGCQLPRASVDKASSRAYELYAGSQAAHVTLRLQACVGAAIMYVCDGSCGTPYQPGPDDYTWRASSGAVTTTAELEVPRAKGTLYMAVQPATASAGLIPADSTTYQLFVGAAGAPLLEAPPKPLVVVSPPQGDGSFTVSWSPPQLRSGGKLTTPEGVSYAVYALRMDEMGEDAIVSTPCGLSAAGKPVVETNKLTAKVKALKPGEHYVINVVASCGSTCGASRVEPLQLALEANSVTTVPANGGGPGSNATVVIVIVLVLVVILALTALTVMYRRNRRLEKELAYELSEPRGLAPTSVSAVGGGDRRGGAAAGSSSGSLSYTPLMDDARGDVPPLGPAGRSLSARISERLGRK